MDGYKGTLQAKLKNCMISITANLLQAQTLMEGYVLDNHYLQSVLIRKHAVRSVQ